MDELFDQIRRGDRSPLARAMSRVDGVGEGDSELEDRLRQATGSTPWWGITGPPGVGKSTLIDVLVGLLREQKRRVGVVAIDPSSPVSRGALLGDRVRMMRHSVDEGVFIRSLATHGREGGLSDAAINCARLLELADFDPVLIETVGVGQNEVDIGSVADLCVVVLGPGYGDGIQLIKAGLLEIPDVVVVNKCDLPGANRLISEVEQELGAVSESKHVEVLGVEATSGTGVDRLLEMLLDLDREARGDEQRQVHRARRVHHEIRRRVLLHVERAIDRTLEGSEGQELISGLDRGELSIDSVMDRLSRAASRVEIPQAGDGLG